MSEETARQRFIRNHDENIVLMKAAHKKQVDAGETENASRIAEIIATWERIGDQAKREEASGGAA